MKEATFYIYELLDPRKNYKPFYVGLTQYPRARFSEHLKEASSGHQSHKCNTIRKIRKACLRTKFKVIEKCNNAKQAGRSEIKWIAHYGFDNLTNQTYGGDGMPGFMHTEEAKKKISISQKGIMCTEETKKKISIANKGKLSQYKGVPRSEETKKKISIATMGKNKGKPSWNKGKFSSAETRKKISMSKKGTNMGHICSAEMRRKIGLKHKGKTISEEHKKQVSRAAELKREMKALAA